MTRAAIHRRLVLALTPLLIDPGSISAQELSAVMPGGEAWRTGYEPLDFVLSRPISDGEQVSIILGTTDVTDLCTRHGDTLRYRPLAVPIPRGSVSVTVYQVTPDGIWNTAGSFTVNVLTATGLERSLLAPSVTLSYNGQVVEDHFPESNAPARSRFHELNGQLVLKAEVERDGVAASLSANIVGVSFQPEALRFAERGADAPKIDLASYLVETGTGKTKFSAGHISHGRSRHLLNNFTSRGVSAASAIGSFADFSGSVLNGTNVVGWNNLFGLASAQHRIYSGTLGLEMIPDNPGTIRVEGSYVYGSQLPLDNFNQSQINDAEESNGGSVRLVLADPGRTVSLDAGLSIARFVNPADPLLSQGNELVPVEPTTRQARYADVTWDVFVDETLLEALPARLQMAYRHERVDPLYRAVGANVRADFLANTLELRGGLGPLQLGLVHQRSEDNLDEVASVLKSKTRQTGINAVLSPITMAEILPSWLPSVSYGLNATHQFGVSTPTNSEFTPSRVPDQLTTSHSAGLEWEGSGVRVGYRGSFTTQDNRQPGRENADAVNRTNSLTLSVSPAPEISAAVEGTLESNENFESGAVLRNRRIGANVIALLFAGATASMTASLSVSEPDDGSSLQRQALFSLETSYAFDLSSHFVFAWRGRLFARYSWSEFELRDNVFDLATRTRAWVINTGLSFTLF